MYNTLQCFLFTNIVFLLCHPYISEMLYLLPYFMVFPCIAIIIIYLQDTIITIIIIILVPLLLGRVLFIVHGVVIARTDFYILKYCITVCRASTLFCVTLVVVAIFPATFYCQIWYNSVCIKNLNLSYIQNKIRTKIYW